MSALLGENSPLNRKDTWFDQSEEAALRIASILGYVLNDNFVAALENYRGIIRGATVQTHLAVVAEGHMRNWQPPLEKMPSPRSTNGIAPQPTSEMPSST